MLLKQSHESCKKLLLPPAERAWTNRCPLRLDTWGWAPWPGTAQLRTPLPEGVLGVSMPRLLTPSEGQMEELDTIGGLASSPFPSQQLRFWAGPQGWDLVTCL